MVNKVIRQKHCHVCGSLFDRNKRFSDKQWEETKCCSRQCAGDRARKIKSKSEIVEMYINGKSSREIGEFLNISGTHILRILKECGCGVRSLSDGKKLSHNKPEIKEKIRNSATGRRLSEHAKDKLRGMIGPKNGSWKGGKTNTGNGYLTYTKSLANGANAGKSIHRVIAEQKAGRPLLSSEIVHHKDRNKQNNMPDNLEIMTQAEHVRLHRIERGCLNV